ncbi:MAG TPA: aldo/keto reductase [Dehalococcoidia bacterium]|nr:aldo/keto reductase [Dehalococcoidia bacterium]
MKYRKLGRTGLMVSEICLGTMTFGNQIDEAASAQLIRWSLDAGINFIDTADQYVDGRTEEIVGKALKGKRHSVVLATKVGSWQSGPGVNDCGLSRQHIMDGIENSLRRLGTDYVDIYYCHRPDDTTPIEETLRALDDLVRQGKVRYIGCSNYAAWQLCKALWVSDFRNLARFDCIQPPYNLITRGIEDEVLSLCASEGVGVCVYNPLAGGLLTGKHDPSRPPPEDTRFGNQRQGKTYTDRYWLAGNFEAVARFKEIAAKHGRSMPRFSLAWILNNPAITSVICGANSIKQLEENVGAVEITLTEEELSVCDEVWHQLRPPRFTYVR